MKTCIFKRMCVILLALVFLPLLVVQSYACDAADYSVPDDHGWKWYTGLDNPFLNYAHMGQKGTTVYYNPVVMDGFEDYIYGGIALWGSNISCVEKEEYDAAIGDICKTSVLYTTEDGSPIVAYTEITANADKHVTSWTITICYSHFYNLSEEEKVLVMAHEIGHAYGLAHVSQPNHLMYPTASESQFITADDIMGMSIMTHTHTHGGYSYSQLSSMRHNRTCNACGASKVMNCSVTNSWHSGNLHYYEYDCPCGNYDLVSVLCTSGTCIDVMNTGKIEAE